MARMEWMKLLSTKRPKELWYHASSEDSKRNRKEQQSEKKPLKVLKNMHESENDFFACFPATIREFMIDYSSITNSSYFRRLQDKTQVYSLDSNDFVRTRLTHSMEVASIAEQLGRLVGPEVMEKENPESEEWMDFTERLIWVLRCIGLLHDLGNPPFGHSGEGYIKDYFNDRMKKAEKYKKREELGLSDDEREELEEESQRLEEEGILFENVDFEESADELTEIQKIFKQMGQDLLTIDGNAQNIRIATKHAHSADPDQDTQYYGMNLTCAVLNGLVKYPHNSLVVEHDSEGKRKQKVGYYYAEEWIMDKVLKETGCGSKKDPIMLLMEAADDIAYNTADLEDAIKNKKITYEDLRNASNDQAGEENGDEENVLIIRAERLWKDMLEDLDQTRDEEDRFRLLQNTLKTYRMLWVEYAKERFMNYYDEIMEGQYKGDLTQEFRPKALEDGIKKLFKTKIYPIRDAQTEKLHRSKSNMYEILDYLIKASDKNNRETNTLKEYMILSKLDQYLEKASQECKNSVEKIQQHIKVTLETEEQKVIERYYHYMAVVDYVTGMTDSYVSVFHEMIYGDDYYQKSIIGFKKNCLEEISEIPIEGYQYRVAGEVLRKLKYVNDANEWTEIEKGCLLKVVLKHCVKTYALNSLLDQILTTGEDYIFTDGDYKGWMIIQNILETMNPDNACMNRYDIKVLECYIEVYRKKDTEDGYKLSLRNLGALLDAAGVAEYHQKLVVACNQETTQA